MIPYISCFLCGYLVGSFPTGYLLVKHNSRIDLTQAGSGNVGALNAGVVTGSTTMGILVGVIDGLKGLAVVLVVDLLTEGFVAPALGLIGAVLGHNYPLWLRFKGGRGLATACGGLFALGLAYTIIWCSTWALMKFARRSVLEANTTATVLTPLALFLVPGSAISAMMTSSGDPASYRWFSVLLSGLLLVSHTDALKEITQRKPNNEKRLS